MLKNASLVLGSLALSLLGLRRKLGTQHRTKVCCLELMIICDLGAHVVMSLSRKSRRWFCWKCFLHLDRLGVSGGSGVQREEG